MNRNGNVQRPVDLRFPEIPANVLVFAGADDLVDLCVGFVAEIMNRFAAGTAKAAFFVGLHGIPVFTAGLRNANGVMLVAHVVLF